MTFSRIFLIIWLVPFLAGCLTACKSGGHDIILEDLDFPEPTVGQSDFSSTRQKTVGQIVYQISANATVDGKAVSIDGHQSVQYKQFLLLKSLATEDELVLLTEHKSGNVKAYAFEALCDRNSKYCKKVLEQHLADKTEIQELSGCLQLPNYINVFYFQLLSRKLSSNEIAYYKKRLAANFSKNEWAFIKEISILPGS